MFSANGSFIKSKIESGRGQPCHVPFVIMNSLGRNELRLSEKNRGVIWLIESCTGNQICKNLAHISPMDPVKILLCINREKKKASDPALHAG